MAANYSRPNASNQQRNRFSFAPPTPIQLQRSDFCASSPTNSDIDASTMSTLSPQLAPISRSISVLVEQRSRQEQQARAQVQLTTTPIHEESIPQSQSQTHTRDGQPSHASADTSHRPRLSIHTAPGQIWSADQKDGANLTKPYYLQPPSDPYPSQIESQEDIKKETQTRSQKPSLPASGTLYPAYKSDGPLYSPHSLSKPNAIQDHGILPQPSFSRQPPAQSHEFESGFCSISSACCLSFVCPCIVYGKTQYRLNQKSSGKAATDLLGYSAANASCLLMALGCCFSGVLATIQRTRVRKAYSIEGGLMDDLLKGCCCCCCVLAQDENEIVKREEHAANIVQTSYVSPIGMAYPPPPRR